MNIATAAKAWAPIPIEQVYSGLFDGPHATPPPADEGPIFLGIKNITEDGRLDFAEVRHISEEHYSDWTRRVAPRPGDIVFTYEATLNRYAIIPQGFRGCLGRRLALIRPNPAKVDTHFLFYYFFGDAWRRIISKHTLAGATVDRIPLTTFPQFEIVLPPLPTQHKIAAILSAYDSLIENNTRRIAILEEMVHALYREWFINFRFPGYEQAKMIESPLGLIPTEWLVTKVGDIAKVYRGRSYRSEDLVEVGGKAFLNLKCIQRNGGFRYDGIKGYIGPFTETQTAQTGDIIMAVTDMTQERRIVARVARLPNLTNDASVISMDLIKIAPIQDEDREYLYAMLRFSGFSDVVKQYANGANVLHLNPEHISKYVFALPPVDVRRKFGSLCSHLFSQCDVLNAKNGNLRLTRDLLLPKLISGEIDVEHLDIVENVA